MIDSLDLNAIRTQVARVEQRIKWIKAVLRSIAGLFLLLACGALFLVSLELQVNEPTGRGGASSRTNDDTPETSILSPLISPSCQCISVARELAVVASISAAIWGILLPATTTIIRQGGFANQRQTKEALDQLNIATPESAPMPTNYFAIIMVGIFVFFIIAALMFFVANIDFNNLETAIGELIKIVFVLLVLMVVLLVGYVFFPFALQKYVYNLMTRGKYEQSLENIIQLRYRFPNQIIFIHLHGLILGTMDRSVEAQQHYLEYFGFVRRLNVATATTTVLNNLAYEYMMEGRDETEQSMFETGIKLYPPLAHPFHNLGWLYLEAGKQPERAIELIEFGISLIPKQDKARLATHLATLAWAYGLSGNRQQAEKSIDDALRLANPQLITYAAHIHYMAGRAKQALEDVEDAHKHFSTAAQLDPQGRNGHLAQRALDEMQSNP